MNNLKYSDFTSIQLPLDSTVLNNPTMTFLFKCFSFYTVSYILGKYVPFLLLLSAHCNIDQKMDLTITLGSFIEKNAFFLCPENGVQNHLDLNRMRAHWKKKHPANLAHLATDCKTNLKVV